MKKINRRSFLAACGVAAAAAALTACGGSSSSSTAASTAASQAGSAASGSGSADFSGRTLTVGIWGGNDQETAAINQLKDNFEAEHGCTVELKVYTDFNTQFKADLIGQTHPDAATHRGVAVAVDRRVVPRSAWADTALVAGARVEFVTAVQGG